MSPATTRSSPGTGSLRELSQATKGLSGIMASSPGSCAGSARRRATSCRKSMNSGATGTFASSSPHCSTER